MFSVLIPTFNQSRVHAFRILTYCRPIGGIFCLHMSFRSLGTSANRGTRKSRGTRRFRCAYLLWLLLSVFHRCRGMYVRIQINAKEPVPPVITRVLFLKESVMFIGVITPIQKYFYIVGSIDRFIG